MTRREDARPNNDLTVAIVGVGLIGGSLGMAWRAGETVRRVIGIVRRPEAVEEVVAVGACDEATLDLAAGVAEADVVVVCTPVTTIVPTVQRLMPHVRPGCIVTDAGSTKRQICGALWQSCRDDVIFIGGHPMAGSEREGVQAADPYLFQNAVYVLTPPPCVNPDVLDRLRSLVEATGAHPVVMDPERHDLIVAAVSHVPHLMAATLVQTALAVQASIPETLNLAAGGFRDTTRIASGSPEIWRDICLTNRLAIQEVLGHLRAIQERLEEALAAADGEGIERFLAEARETRSKIPSRAKGILTSLHEIVVQVIDRPGEIAAVSGLLAEAGINIIDIEIMRVREGEGGTLRLGFEQENLANEALRILMQQGYTARRR